jgi:hypothetical protein
MAYTPNNPNGQAVSASSSPVVIASDQSAVEVKGDVAAGVAVAGVNPVLVGVSDGTNVSQMRVNVASDTAGAALLLGVSAMLYNTSTNSRPREVINATNSTGTGIAAAGILGQFDDTSPTSITENQFGNLRMSANRNLYNTIRDAAGNERGANVDASNRLSVAVGELPGWSATYISTQTDTTVKASAGVLHSITVGSPITTGVIKLWDGAAGTTQKGQIVTSAANQTPYTIILDMTFSTSLHIETQNADQLVTVTWR